MKAQLLAAVAAVSLITSVNANAQAEVHHITDNSWEYCFDPTWTSIHVCFGYSDYSVHQVDTPSGNTKYRLDYTWFEHHYTDSTKTEKIYTFTSSDDYKTLIKKGQPHVRKRDYDYGWCYPGGYSWGYSYEWQYVNGEYKWYVNDVGMDVVECDP